jgi:hypothetical protein
MPCPKICSLASHGVKQPLPGSGSKVPDKAMGERGWACPVSLTGFEDGDGMYEPTDDTFRVTSTWAAAKVPGFQRAATHGLSPRRCSGCYCPLPKRRRLFTG